MDINNLKNIILNSDEEVTQFLNGLTSHDDFEQGYIIRKICKIKGNKDMLFKNASFFLKFLINHPMFDNSINAAFYLNIMDVNGSSIQDQRDFVEKNKPFIFKIDSKLLNKFSGTMVTFKTKAEAEQFVEDWNKLDELHRIIKFLYSNKIQYSNHEHYEVICREFVLIDKNKDKDPIKTIKKMFDGDYTNEQIEGYWIMNKLTK